MDTAGPESAASAASLSPPSPASVRSPAVPNGGSKRKRSSVSTAAPPPPPPPPLAESSPGSPDDDSPDHLEKKRQPGVKRACNECRQQKVSQCRRRENVWAVPPPPPPPGRLPAAGAGPEVCKALSKYSPVPPRPRARARSSSDAMSYKTPSAAARGVTASSSSAR